MKPWIKSTEHWLFFFGLLLCCNRYRCLLFANLHKGYWVPGLLKIEIQCLKADNIWKCFWWIITPPNEKIPNSFADNAKATARFWPPIGSVYTLLFVITSAHTLLGPFMQLYTGNFIWSVFTCTAFCHYKCIHFEWLSLLYILTLATHTRGAHTVLGSVVLLYIHTLVQSLFSGNVYTTALYNCTLASASLGPVLSTNHRRASIYLLHCDWFF